MNSLTGPLCAFLSSCTWAAGVTAYARLGRTLPPWAINTTRMAIALPILFVLVLVSGTFGGPENGIGRLSHLSGHNWLWLSLSMLGSYALGDALFLKSAELMGASAALAVASVFPLPAALAGTVLRGERLATAQWTGLVGVIAGTVIVIVSAEPSQPHPSVSARTTRGRVWLGGLLALVVAGLWALNAYGVGEGSRGLPVLPVALLRMGMGLILAPLAGAALSRLFARSWRPVLVPWRTLRPLLGLFAIESVGGAFTYTYGMSHSSVAAGAALSSLAPVLAVPLAVATGAEVFSWRKSTGIALVVAGLSLLVVTPGR